MYPFAPPSEAVTSNLTKCIWNPALSVKVFNWNSVSGNVSGKKLVVLTSIQSPLLALMTNGSTSIHLLSTPSTYFLANFSLFSFVTLHPVYLSICSFVT